MSSTAITSASALQYQRIGPNCPSGSTSCDIRQAKKNRSRSVRLDTLWKIHTTTATEMIDGKISASPAKKFPRHCLSTLFAFMGPDGFASQLAQIELPRQFL